MSHQDPGDEKTPAPDAPDAPASDPGGWRGFVKRNRQLLQHWTLFLVIIGVMTAASEFASYWVNVRLSEWTADLMGRLMRLLGHATKVDGVHITSRVCRFEIIGECTAYFPISIFVAAVLAYPCKVTRRLAGLAIGIPVLLVINQVRLISLCYLMRWRPDLFEVAHIVVWQSLIIFFTVFSWVVWVSTLARGHETS